MINQQPLCLLACAQSVHAAADVEFLSQRELEGQRLWKNSGGNGTSSSPIEHGQYSVRCKPGLVQDSHFAPGSTHDKIAHEDALTLLSICRDFLLLESLGTRQRRSGATGV